MEQEKDMEWLKEAFKNHPNTSGRNIVFAGNKEQLKELLKKLGVIYKEDALSKTIKIIEHPMFREDKEEYKSTKIELRPYDLKSVPKKKGTHPPHKRKEEKTGNNDPCTCGSGKKYKKCCKQ